MTFQPGTDPIVWRLHLRAGPELVYDALDSDAERTSFWAESAVERNGVIEFSFVNGARLQGRILTRRRPVEWSIDYFSSVATFTLAGDGSGGTDLTLTNTGVRPEDRCEIGAGWLNVLPPLKAWVDHGVDLRSHDPSRTWDQAYVDQVMGERVRRLSTEPACPPRPRPTAP